MCNQPASPLDGLREHVQAAASEFDKAVMFYEVWRTGMDDAELHERLGVSYATNAFRIVVTALRRELILALTRIWDKPRGSIRIEEIARAIRDPKTIDILTAEAGGRIHRSMIRPGGNVSRASLDAISSSVKESMKEKAEEVLALADKYGPNGAGYPLLDKLKNLRNERLAHFDLKAASVPAKNATDDELEVFYLDSSELVRLLLSLVRATAYDPQQGAEVQRTYAKLFWASVKGEKTKGHPNYRPPLTD